MQTQQLSLETARQPDILERVKNVADACRELNKDIDTLYDHAKDDQDRARIEIETVAEALREGKPASECFYYPYFVRSGSGFSFYDRGYDPDFSSVGARLRVPDAKTARHLGRCMAASYNIYLGGK